MPLVRDVLAALEEIAPSQYAYSFDRIGLQIGDPDAGVERVAVALDPSLAAARFARENGAQMLVCHHPVIWDPLEHLRYDTYKGRVVRELVEGGVAFAAAHTNWDCAPGGINDVLAELIGLSNVRPTGSSSDKETTKIVVTSPGGSEDAIVNAMSSAGAGVIGLYERCAFSVAGDGTFRGKAGSNPTVGSAGRIESVEESRIEMVCPAEAVPAVVEALVAAHPYEEPAYDVYPLKSKRGHPISRIGSLPAPVSQSEFRDMLDGRLRTRTLLCAPPDASIQTVVVCGGAAADEWINAKGAADAFVTGEIPHHLMVEGSETGVAMAAAGHYATENPGTMRLADLLAERFDVVKFEPPPTQAGRP